MKRMKKAKREQQQHRPQQDSHCYGLNIRIDVSWVVDDAENMETKMLINDSKTKENVQNDWDHCVCRIASAFSSIYCTCTCTWLLDATIDGQESSTCDNCPSVQWMVNLEASAQVKCTTLLGYNLVYSISSEVVLGVSCCCVLSPFISHHDSRLFAELKLRGYLCCHFFLFSFYGFSQKQEWKCLLLVCLFSCRSVGAYIWHSNVNCQW